MKPSRRVKRRVAMAEARTARQRVWEHYPDKQCVYCGKPADSVDHVLPRARGGADRLDNLVPACLACNRRKSDKSPWEFFYAVPEAAVAFIRRARHVSPRWRQLAGTAWSMGGT